MLGQRTIQQTSALLSDHLRDVLAQTAWMVEDDVTALMTHVAIDGEGAVVRYADNEQFKKMIGDSSWSVVDLVDEHGEVLNSSDDSRVGLSYQDDAQTKAVLDEALEEGSVATSVIAGPPTKTPGCMCSAGACRVTTATISWSSDVTRRAMTCCGASI